MNLFAKKQQNYSDKRKRGNGSPGDDIVEPPRGVGLGNLDGDGDFLDLADDFFFVRDFGGDLEGGAFVFDGVVEMTGCDGGGGDGKGGFEGGCRVGCVDERGFCRQGSGYDGVADRLDTGECGGVVNCDSHDARAAGV